MSTIWAFYHVENKHNLYRGKYCMKKLCECLREHAKNTTNFEKKKEELKLHENAKVHYIR